MERVETEVWARNPKTYVRECRDVLQTDILLHAGYCLRAGIDPVPFMETFYGALPWRVLWVDWETATEINSVGKFEDPVGHWPVWNYGDRDVALETLLVEANKTNGRVLVASIPDTKTELARRSMMVLAEMQQEYPNARMHICNLYSWRYAFGLGFFSADVEPRFSAQLGSVMLPNGKLVRFEETVDMKEWVQVIGYKPKDLEIPRNRCMFNLESARWAGRYYRKNVLFKTRGFDKIDPFNPKPPRLLTQSVIIGRHKAKEGDYFNCDTCSLADKCRFFRVRSLCSVPGTEGQQMASQFATRDADQVIAALGALQKKAVTRTLDALEAEEQSETINPHVTKMLEGVFSQGERLAKLLRPALNGAGAGALPPAAESPQALMAAIVKELEDGGVPRNLITEEMVNDLLRLKGEADRTGAIAAIAQGVQT